MTSDFYFYRLQPQIKDGSVFEWEKILETLLEETKNKTPHYEQISFGALSVHVLKKDIKQEKFYFGFLVVSEDKGDYKKEKQGIFSDLGFGTDENLCHTHKGKLYFMIHLDEKNNAILMLEKQYFAINISGFLGYFKKRYSDKIEDLAYKTILGKELRAILSKIKNDKLRVARIRLRNSAIKDLDRKFGYVEDAIESFKKQGVYAEIVLHWDKPSVSTGEFLSEFFKAKTFNDALDVNFGEFLKVFSFKTDSEFIPELNLLNRLIKFTLPFDKAMHNDDEIFSAVKEFYTNNQKGII